jgi:hypothetical protein
METLAEETGYSRREVISAVQELEQGGFFSVTRGERKSNLYHVNVAAAYGAENAPVHFSTKTSAVCAENVSQNALKEEPIKKIEKKSQTKQKFSNPLWDLQHGKTPELTEEDNENIKLEQGYKAIASKLETGLRRGEFPQTPKAQVVYRWILKKEKNGQSLERFIQWAMRDDKAASFSWIYHKDIELIKRDWMQAFPAASNPGEKRASSFYG